jgi:uncharacterized membrane protein YagU involved in acid resistance
MEATMAKAWLDETSKNWSVRLVWVGVLAGVSAAIIEIIPILVIQGLLLHVGPTRILQAIASGVLGAQAYTGGASTAILGALLHTGISIAAGLAFSFGTVSLPILLRRPVVSGLAYGILVYLLMSYIVVPLSAAAFKAATNPMLIGMSLTIHMVAFALPISLLCRRLIGRSSTNLRPAVQVPSDVGRSL